MAIEARGLVKRFDGFTAVDGIDLSVPEGAIYGILGPNGAGKTTTLRIIAGLETADLAALGSKAPLVIDCSSHIASAVLASRAS